MSGSPAPGPTVEPSGPRGPLRIRAFELASIGPIPFCGMVLSDMGADVIRLDRMAAAAAPSRCSIGAAARSPSTSSSRTDWRRPRPRCRLGRAHRGLPAGRRRASRRRPGRVPRSQPARIRADDRVGSLVHSPIEPDTTSIISLSQARSAPSVGRASHRCLRSASSPTSALAACCSPTGSPARSSSGRPVAQGRSSMRRCWTGPCCSWARGSRRSRPGRGTTRGTNNLDSGAPYYDSYRCADGEYGGRCAGAAVLRPAARGPRSRRAVDPGSQRSANWPRFARCSPNASPRGPGRVGRPLRGRGCMRRAGLKLAEVPAIRRSPPGDDRLRRRRGPSCAGAASIGHRERSPARQPTRRRHRRGPRRSRLRRADRPPPTGHSAYVGNDDRTIHSLPRSGEASLPVRPHEVLTTHHEPGRPPLGCGASN